VDIQSGDKMKTKDKCFFCNKTRTGKWALLFGPPKPAFVPEVNGPSEITTKLHICPKCYIKILEMNT